jgi:hypothetical protein
MTFMASAFPAAAVLAIAKLIVTAINVKHPTFHQRLRQFFSGFQINALHRGASDIHMAGAFLLVHTFYINQTNGFIFIHRHLNNLLRTSASA